MGVEVSNVGPGIPSEKIASIFDPVCLPVKPARRRAPGLGLYIVQSKVISMNGTIQVQSKPGGYTNIQPWPWPRHWRQLRNLSKWDEGRENSEEQYGGILAIFMYWWRRRQELTALLLIRSLKGNGMEVTIVNNGLELLLAAQKDIPIIVPTSLSWTVICPYWTAKKQSCN